MARPRVHLGPRLIAQTHRHPGWQRIKIYKILGVSAALLLIVFFLHRFRDGGGGSSALPDSPTVLGAEHQENNSGNYYYEAQPDDSLFSISEKFQISWETIVSLNGLKEPFTISAGQKIKLPANAQTREQQFYDNLKKKVYIVEAGDTFVGISQKINASVNDLLTANPDLKSPELLRPGQILRLP